MKKTLIIKTHFDAAHKITDYKGQCANLHGHRWKVIIEMEYQKLEKNNIAVDFKELKEVINNCLPDHKYLNEWYIEKNVTAEWMIEVIRGDIDIKLNNNFGKDIKLTSLELWESEKAGVRYEV